MRMGVWRRGLGGGRDERVSKVGLLLELVMLLLLGKGCGGVCNGFCCGVCIMEYMWEGEKGE